MFIVRVTVRQYPNSNLLGFLNATCHWHAFKLLFLDSTIMISDKKNTRLDIKKGYRGYIQAKLDEIRSDLDSELLTVSMKFIKI